MSTKTIRNGEEWTVREGYEKIPDMFGADDFLSGLKGKRYRLVKENRVRSVISLSGPDMNENAIYIKHFRSGGFCDYIKYLFVPTRARTEWEVGNALLHKKINTALPLAISEGKKSLLMITEAVTNSIDLMDFCQSNYNGNLSVRKKAEKRALLEKLARFIRDIHEKGICHYDLHTGNILIRFKNEPEVSGYDLYLMDLHRVKICRNISIRKRVFNIAQIFNSLSSIITEADKLDFIQSYGINALIRRKKELLQYRNANRSITSHSRGENSKKHISPAMLFFPLEEEGKGEVRGFRRDVTGIERTLVKQIDEQSSRIRDIHLRSRLKRCLKESSDFSRKRLAGMKLYFRKGYDIDNFQELIEKNNTALVNNDRAVIIKCDTKTAVTRFSPGDKRTRGVVVKQYKAGCAEFLMKNILLGSVGRRAWVAGNGLRVYGFNTPLPLALLEKKISGITTDSYIIMEDVKESLEMDRYILKNFQNRKDFIKKRKLISEFAKILAKMHNRNVFHYDLKTCNIMVKERGVSFDFTFLDFDKVSFRRKITVRKRIKNLTQLNLSTPRVLTITDRLRFLKEYLNQCSIINEKMNILRKIINLCKTEKILYVSFEGDVTEDW